MDTDLRQSDEWASYLQHLGWDVEEIKGTRSKIASRDGRDKKFPPKAGPPLAEKIKNAACKIYIKKIPFIGSVIKIQRPSLIPPIKEIDKLARKHHALIVKLEPLPTTPLSRLTTHDFLPDPSPNLPTKTIVNDLTKSEKEMWTNLSRDARQSIKKAQSSELRVASFEGGEENFAQALVQFHKLLSETSQRQGFWVSSLEQLQNKCQAFGKNAVLLLVYPPNQPIAGHPWRASPSAKLALSGSPSAKLALSGSPLGGALFLVADKTAFYHHAASSKEGQALFAPYLLLWEALRFFKPTAHYLDHEGVVDPRFPQTKRWEKFTVFKRKWGGKEVTYPPPLIKYYSPVIKLLFALGGRLG